MRLEIDFQKYLFLNWFLQFNFDLIFSVAVQNLQPQILLYEPSCDCGNQIPSTNTQVVVKTGKLFCKLAL